MKRISLYKSLCFLVGLLLFSCISDASITIQEGKWALWQAKKNNIETRMLDGAYFHVYGDTIVSNIVNGEQPATFKFIGSTILTSSEDRFDIVEASDTSLVLETIKSRNLFRIYLKPQE